MARSLNQLISEQMVSQFDNVVREEIRKHNISIQNSNASLKELQETFREFSFEHKNLRSTNEALYSQTQKHFEESKKELTNSFDDQRAFIKENSKQLQKTITEFEQSVGDLIDQRSFDRFKNETRHYFNSLYKELEKNKEEMRTEIYNSHEKTKASISDEKIRAEEHFYRTAKQLKLIEKGIDVCKTEARGVLKEHAIYKRKAFIMEKKIENIYSQIDRINKRIDVSVKGAVLCPKLVS